MLCGPNSNIVKALELESFDPEDEKADILSKQKHTLNTLNPLYTASTVHPLYRAALNPFSMEFHPSP